MDSTTKHKNISIAILPFQVIATEDRIEDLFMGFMEDLITHFSKFLGLSVISSYSSMQIKDIRNQSEVDRLGADYLVYGSVRQNNQALKISIQLMNAHDKSVVFARQYEETLDTVIDTQDRIIKQIVSALEEKVNYNLLSHSYKKKHVELAAYENYLLGMNVLRKGSGDHDKKSRVYFNNALKIDPNYSLAYTGLSLSYFNFWSCLLWDRWDESMKGAHQYALKATELDPNDYTALGILGRTYVYKGEYEKAEYCLRKSLRMNPNDASHLLRVSFSLMQIGFADEAVSLYHKAIDINPFHKDVYFAYGSNYYLQAGDFEKSIALSKKVPFNCWTDFPAWVAAAYLQINDYENLWKCWDIFIEQFEAAAYTGSKHPTEEAIEWLLILNPFKGDNYIQHLCEFVWAKMNIQHPLEPSFTPSDNPSFIINGDFWAMNYKKRSVLLKDAKGYHDIQKLLSRPSEVFHCMDLMGSAVDETRSVAATDSKARSAYEKRMKELQAEISEAEAMNQIEHISSLREEYEAILDHLSKSMGLSGKSRKVGSTVEKARSAVTWRIRSALKKIEKSHPELGKHLSRSIKTGTYCSYRPERPIDWTI